MACIVALLLGASCLTPRIEGDDTSFLDRDSDPISTPPDCDDALFARTYAQCPSVEMSFPKIWSALNSLTREQLMWSIDDKQAALDRCCAGEQGILDIDLVVGCDGSVIAHDVDMRGTWISRPALICVRDQVASWKFDRPSRHEQGAHVLLRCGP